MLRADVRGVAERRDAEFDAALPERIVVVGRIDRDRLPALGELPELRRVAEHLGIRLADLGADHHRLVPEFEHRVLEFANRLFRRIRRDDGRRADAVLDVAEHVGVHHVERAAAGGAQFVVAHVERGKPRRRQHVGEIDAALFHPRGEVSREHRHRAVGGMRGRRVSPPDHLGRPVRRGPLHPAGLDLRAGDLTNVFVEQPLAFDDVAVGIDDRVIELSANLAAGKLRVA